MSDLGREQAEAWRAKAEREQNEDAGLLGIGGPRVHFSSAPTRKVTMKISEAVIAFVDHADRVRDIVRMKDEAYGGAWQRQGYMGNLARIMSKAARLENILWRDNPEEPAVRNIEEETVLDTLHDLMALAAFMANNIEDGNRWGRP